MYYSRCNSVLRSGIHTSINDRRTFIARMPDKRAETLVIRVTAAEKRLISRAAELDHYDVSPWARALLLREAERRVDDGKRR
jgi:uncharacterized protein (DUF1778 family)